MNKSSESANMKKISVLIICLAITLSLIACSVQTDSSGDYFGFGKNDFTVEEEADDHGGFLGDGLYYLIMDCSSNKEKAFENVSGWNELPLSENLSLVMYGGEKDGEIYGYNLAEKAKIPNVENGCYYFRDRHSESSDSSDDSELFSRSSFNFSLAVYDRDTNKFYYFAFDT